MMNPLGEFRSFSFSLESLWCDAVTTVADASTALDMLRERKDGDDQFDVVISDFFMPNGINGLKLLELIALEMDIPVIGIALALLKLNYYHFYVHSNLLSSDAS